MPVDPYASVPAETFTEAMWKEAASSWRASGENIFNKRSGEAALAGYIPSACLKAAMRYMLGYEQVSQSAPFIMSRKNPVRHPYYEQLWCNGVSEVEFKPNAASAAALKKASLAVPTNTPAPLGYRTGYNVAKLLVRFAPTRCDFREDNDLTYPDVSTGRKEYLRNLELDTQPRTETFESKLVYVFQEGTCTAAGYSSPAAAVAQAEQAQILVKPDVTMTWRDVPEAWIMATNTRTPTNILEALGKVNGNTFFGYLPGTLLLVAARLDRHPWTLKARPGLTGSDLESNYLYDVEFMYSFFDPLKGYTGDPPVLITGNRGHNNFPYRGTGIAAGVDNQIARWFYATVQGSNGRPLYEYITFDKHYDCPQNYP